MSTGMLQPLLDKPDDETLKKIDFVIQGLENGQFKDLAKKVDFHQKLKGEESKRFLKSLIDAIEAQSFEIGNLQNENNYRKQEIGTLESRIIELETQLADYTKNMRSIANALSILSDPPDPLNQKNQKYRQQNEAEDFVDNWMSKY